MPVRTEPYSKRAVPSNAGEIPAFLRTELGDIQRALPVLTRAFTFANAAPTTGRWIRGDIVLNDTPSAGGFIGWVCVTAGVPGTWKTWGVISP
jgi:hypothetical protein